MNLGPNSVLPEVFDPENDPDTRIPAEDGSEVWMYLTQRPLIGLDDVMIADEVTVLQNKSGVVAERGAIVILDDCVVVGAKASVC